MTLVCHGREGMLSMLRFWGFNGTIILVHAYSRKVLGEFVDFVALMMRLSNLKPETPEDVRGQVYYCKLATVCTTGSAPRGTVVWWRQVRQSLRASVNKGGQLLYQDYLTRGPAPSPALRLKDRELQHTGWHTFDWRLGRALIRT